MNIGDLLLSEGVYDKGIFKAIFLGGGPGSGKSFFRDKVLKGHGFKIINPDIFYEHKIQKERIPLKYGTRTPEQEKKHKEIEKSARTKLPKQMKLWLDGRLPILIDRTGAHYEERARDKKELEELGYDTIMIFVDADPKVAMERNLSRLRALDPKYAAPYDKKVRSNIPKFMSLFGKEDFFKVDNTLAFDEKKKVEWNKLWAEIDRWVSEKPTNPTALKWIKQEKEKKKRT